MTHAIQELVIRDVAPIDTAEIASVLAEAMSEQPVARWVMPVAETRRRIAPGYFEIYAEHAIKYGEVYATVDSDDGEVSGVALWFPFTSLIPSPSDYDQRLKEAVGSAYDRAVELDAALEAHHPMDAHHYLAFLAVRPDRQNHGIGSSLLERHHARLDAAGIPAYLESNDPRNRDLYLRHGYVVRSEIRLPDGPPVWPMWRVPMGN
jgi:GNAT superfamily N-acetyltransferase